MTKHTQHKLGKQNEIIHQIESALDQEMQLSSLDIHVDIKEDTVVLTGVVDTLAEKAFAQKVASQVPGVTKVENYLTISTDGTLTDDEIAAHVEQHLREGHQGENLAGVGVKVEGGSAVLMGRVNTLSDKTNAIKAAQKAAGVKDVVSNIKIEPEEDLPMTDDQITNRVVQRFSTSGLSLPDIAIDTQNGEVFLRGYVEDQHMMEVAEELAMNTPGVKKLNNMLRVRDS